MSTREKVVERHDPIICCGGMTQDPLDLLTSRSSMRMNDPRICVTALSTRVHMNRRHSGRKLAPSDSRSETAEGPPLAPPCLDDGSDRTVRNQPQACHPHALPIAVTSPHHRSHAALGMPGVGVLEIRFRDEVPRWRRASTPQAPLRNQHNRFPTTITSKSNEGILRKWNVEEDKR